MGIDVILKLIVRGVSKALYKMLKFVFKYEKTIKQLLPLLQAIAYRMDTDAEFANMNGFDKLRMALSIAMTDPAIQKILEQSAWAEYTYKDLLVLAMQTAYLNYKDAKK